MDPSDFFDLIAAKYVHPGADKTVITVLKEAERILYEKVLHSHNQLKTPSEGKCVICTHLVNLH